MVGHPVPGLVVVAGGKYTTYRVMARTPSTPPSTGWGPVPASCTEQIPLLGADGYGPCLTRRTLVGPPGSTWSASSTSRAVRLLV